jgi:RNA polymerase sigma-70 factor (ECF subfamily)
MVAIVGGTYHDFYARADRRSNRTRRRLALRLALRLSLTAIHPMPTAGHSSEPSPHEVTALLLAWGGGDESALARLVPIVHDELHRIARACMAGEKGGHTLQATALVNEAYLRLIETQGVNWQNRAHFLAMAARLMRRILVDFARSKQYLKRGGGAVNVSLAPDVALSVEPGRDLVALDDALEALAQVDERKSRVIEMRFFGGLSVKESAEALHVSPETVMRDWKLAKAWLLRQLRGADTNAPR